MGEITEKITLSEFNKKYKIIGEISGTTTVKIDNDNSQNIFNHSNVDITEYQSYTIINKKTNKQIVSLFIKDQNRLLNYLCDRFNIDLEGS